MVVLNRIYTRTGDKGETALGDGTRVRKDGAARHRLRHGRRAQRHPRPRPPARRRRRPTTALERIQNDLFDLGADLCTPDFENDAAAKRPRLRIVAEQVARLETEIDAMNADLAPLRSFVLPGGTPLAAHLHLCRTVCRRAERHAVALARAEAVNPEAVRYLNRLSDWLFVAARVANDGGRADVLWVPGANR